jgi:DNA adenine methylase
MALEKILHHASLTKNAVREPGTQEKDKAKPFLHWVGGKREMIEKYPQYIPSTYNKYFEPFLGGGAMLYHLKPKTAFLNDSNEELIKTYKAIQNNPEEVIQKLRFLKERHSKEFYMEVRALDRSEKFSLLTDTDIAARMIYLNQTGFNGVYRVNRQGQYNVPIGSSLNKVICDPVAIRNVSKFIQGYTFSSADFFSVAENIEENDFVYLDPPYVPVSEYSDFTRYTKEQFNFKDQERVFELFKQAAQVNAKVMLSNSDSPLIHELYKDYNIHTIFSSRSLNSKKDKRTGVNEVIITNYEVNL